MRRSYAIIVLLVAATAVCVVPPPSGTEPGEELRMAVWGNPLEDSLFSDGYARDFEQLHPGLRVKYERYEDVTTKYLAWHVLGRGADVMRVRITDYHTFVARGMLEPLNRYIDDPEHGLSQAEQADFIPSIWDALMIDGERYALPSDNAQYGLYYNKALFDEDDDAHPDAPIRYPDNSWTWNDLREAARLLTKRDEAGHIDQYGLDFDLWPWPFMAFFTQAGGSLWDAKQTTTLIDSEAGEEALQYMVDLLPHAGAMRSADVKDSPTGPDKLFAMGRTAMLLDGSWRAPFLEALNPDLDFAIAPLPAHHQRAIVCGSVLWAVSAHSQNKELAWEMVKWMTNFEQSLRYWDTLRVAPPSRMSVIRSDRFRETAGVRDAVGRVILEGMPRERWPDRGAWLLAAITPDPITGAMPGFVPVAPYQKDLEEKINAMLSRAISPGRTQSLEELLRETASEVHRIIDRDRRARGLPAAERDK